MTHTRYYSLSSSLHLSSRTDRFVAVDTSGRIYDDFLRLIFLHSHREGSSLANDIPEESGHFRFLRDVCLGNIKGSVDCYVRTDV